MFEKSPSVAISRRQFVAASLSATSAALVGGCQPPSPGTGQLQLTWGERGLKAGQLQKPRAITIDSDDQLYICDITARIQVFDRDGNYLRSWRTPESKNGRPTGMSVIDDVLYVADTHYFRILAFSLTGELLPELGWGVAGAGPGQIGWSTDIACDSVGSLYISEYGQAERVQKFTRDREFVTEWGTQGTAEGQFLRPQSLVVDANDHVWVCDAGNHRLQTFDSAGNFLRSFGREGAGRGEFSYPYSAVIAPDSSIYVCEYGNHRVQKITPDGMWLGDFGGPGSGPGQMHNPWSCVLDSRGSIHVLDSWNHRVHRVKI